VSTFRRRWRFYATATGRKPAKEFIDRQDDADAAQIVGAMFDVRRNGLIAARHLRGDVYEVRADARHASYRLLFAEEGTRKGCSWPPTPSPRSPRKHLHKSSRWPSVAWPTGAAGPGPDGYDLKGILKGA